MYTPTPALLGANGPGEPMAVPYDLMHAITLTITVSNAFSMRHHSGRYL